MSEMIDALALNKLYLDDALLYSIEVDLAKGLTTLCLEVDTAFHRGINDLGVDGEGEVLVEFIFSGVSAVNIHGLRARPQSWALDEKPHDCEIATLGVSKRKFPSKGYRLDVRCQLGQRCVIDFDGIAMRSAGKPTRVRHQYMT